MKLSAMLAGQRLFPAVAAVAIALAVSGCSDEPRPKPKLAAKAAPSPAAPQTQAEAMKVPPEKPSASNVQATGDQDLAGRVKSALAAGTGFNAHQIDITVKDGAVTLFGTADTKAQREAAGKAAAAVSGVKSVENKLAVVAGS
jgi:osmotically-inducible protein OsmY